MRDDDVGRARVRPAPLGAAPGGSEKAPDTNLTERQLLIWLEHQLFPAVPSSNMVTTFRIAADVDATRFESAFDSVVRSSDALRTVFDAIDGTPQQRVVPGLRADVEHVDLSSEADPEAALRAWTDERRQRLFRLDERAFDTALLRLGPQQTVWYLCLHHLVTDAWSCSLVYERTLRAYLGEPSPPTEPFADYVDHSARYRGSPEHARAEAFWKRRHAVPMEPVRFYGVHASRRAPYFERCTVPLGEARTEALRRVASGSRGTASDATLAAAFTTLVLAYVHRVSGNRHIGLGSPVLNRPSKRFRETIGLFMEVCPLRAEIVEGETFTSLLEKAKRELVEVLPYTRHCTANPSTGRAFDVLLNFHTARFAPLLGPTITSFSTGTVDLGPESPRHAEGLASAEGESLVVSVHDFDRTGALSLTLDFQVDVFDASTRAVAPGHFLRLLDAFIADPGRAIDRVDLLSDEERRHVVHEVHHQPSPARGPEPAVLETVVELFEARAREAPHRIAVSHGDRTLDYRALAARVDRLARRLTELGIGVEDRVAIRFDRSIDMLVALLGTLKAGGAYVPLDPAYPAARVGDILTDARPSALLTSEALRESLVTPTPLPVICVGDHGDGAWSPEQENELGARSRGDRLAYVIFTSGSTGRPKGVEIPHSALTNFLRSMADEPGLAAGERVLALTTIAFDIAALELFLPLTVGATVDIIDRETACDGRSLRAHIEASNPSVVQATPATWRMLVESGWQGSARLRALVGGEALSPDLADELLRRAGSVWNMYGPTETTVWSTIHRVEPRPSPRQRPATIPIGRPIANTRVYVLGPDRAPLPLGVAGELYIGGEGVARGYHGRLDLTDERFVPDPFSGRSGARMYRTGDLASLGADGVLRYHGRADRQIKLRGFRVEPGEIEAVLRSHARVRDAAVVLREIQGDRRLVAYFVGVGERLAPADLRALLSDRLPEYMVPAHFVALAALPLTPNGKVDLAALPAPELIASAETLEIEAPADDREVLLAGLWQELLGVSAIDRRDDFFALGGHSLLAVRLLSKIRHAFGVELSIATLFEHPTLEGLASALSLAKRTGPALVPLHRGGSSAPLFFLCGIQIYHQLAMRLGDQPSYGIFLGVEEKIFGAAGASHVSVSEMAADYIEVIRARQPRGPYRLAGVSFGGVLAFEVAQRLRDAGERVELLALMDSILPRARKRSLVRWASGHLLALLRRDLTNLRAIAHRMGRGLRALRARAGAPLELSAHTDDELADLRERLYLRAVDAYDERVSRYPGSMLLFRARDRRDGEGVTVEPSCGWSQLVTGGLEVIDVPGDHLGILRAPAVDQIAATLRMRLDALERASGADRVDAA